MAGIYSVTQVNAYIRNMFAEDFMLSRIRVRGEASNVRYHSSGHIYFTIKDSGGTLSAVMFASQRKGLSFRMCEGQKIVVTGSIEVYERNGTYQIYAREIEQEGRGDLYEAYLKLKDRLEEMGMFADAYKQPIPKYAHTVGIVTASTGAAIRDIINVSTRRNPYIRLVLCPAQVQGEPAPDSIVQAVRRLDRYGTDVMIVGRGGGSMEDLWAFNDERVARAIFECRTPVISAVGHETDFTIADFVADLRAPTPSAAAELAVYDYAAFAEELQGRRDALTAAMKDRLRTLRDRENRMLLKLRLKSPANGVRERRMRLEELRTALASEMKQKAERTAARYVMDREKLKTLSPLNRLKGGFAYVSGADGRAVRQAADIAVSQRLDVRFADGRAVTTVLEVLKDDKKQSDGK